MTEKSEKKTESKVEETESKTTNDDAAEDVKQSEPKEVDESAAKAAEETSGAEESSKTEKGRKILSDAVENIEGGAKVVGEAVTDLVGKFKKGASEAIKSGSKVVDELSHTAQGYSEKYKAEIEVRKLKNQQDKHVSNLGSLLFKQYKTDGAVKKTFFKDQAVTAITADIQALDEKIVAVGKELDKAEEEK